MSDSVWRGFVINRVITARYNFQGEQWTERADATTRQQAPGCWPLIVLEEAVLLLSRHQARVRGSASLLRTAVTCNERTSSLAILENAGCI